VLRIRDVYLGSRILIFTHPGSRISDPGSQIPDLGSRSPDPKTATKERGEKKFVVTPFLWPQISQNCKKMWANFQRILELFTQNIVTKLSKIWVWDPGVKKVKKAPDPGPWIRIRNTGSWGWWALRSQINWVWPAF
jgi:hypothetical protein